MQVGRLFEMVYLLLERGNVTAKELAGRFEVSERTIYRDVDVLSAAGIPVYTAKGKGGGIAFCPTLCSTSRCSPKRNRKTFCSACRACRQPDTRKPGRYLKAAHLLSQGGPRLDRRGLYQLGEAAKRKKNGFDRLRGAILSRRQVTFDYVSAAGKETKRT